MREDPIPQALLTLAIEITDSNAVLSDTAHSFVGCIAGIHEVLRRQGFKQGNWCLNENEKLSTGQSAEIDRIYNAYPYLNDGMFVRDKFARLAAGITNETTELSWRKRN